MSHELLGYLAAVCLGGSALAGCSSNDAAAGGAKPSPAGGFVADAPGSGRAVLLTASKVVGKQLTLELRGRELSSLSGVAYRLSYDPAVLRFTAQQASGAFGAPGASVAATKEARPGLLVGALGVKGSGSIDAPATALGELEFEIVGAGQTRIDFVVSRSAALNPQGEPLASVTLLGGMFGPP